jgi:peroxiredoxin
MTQIATLEIGQGLIDAELKTTSGKAHRLSSFKQELLAVIFMCNHCPYVVGSIGHLVDLANKHGEKVGFIAINSNDYAAYPADSPEGMDRFAAEHKIPFPYVLDETQDVARQYGALRTPEIFLFDQARKLRYHGRVNDQPKERGAVKQRDFADAIAALLAGRQPAEPVTQALGCTIKWKPGNAPAA